MVLIVVRASILLLRRLVSCFRPCLATYISLPLFNGLSLRVRV